MKHNGDPTDLLSDIFEMVLENFQVDLFYLNNVNHRLETSFDLFSIGKYNFGENGRRCSSIRF